MADLVALDAAAEHRARLLARARELDGARRRLGAIEGVSNALGGLFASLAGLSILVLAIPLVTAGTVEGVFLAALPLAAIAAFEAVQPLSRSLQLLDSTRVSARRLFELIDEPPPVADPAQPSARPAAYDLDVRRPVLPLRRVRAVGAAGPRRCTSGQGSGSPSSVPAAAASPRWCRCCCASGTTTTAPSASAIASCASSTQEIARAMLSVVPQDVYLFNATIEDNLAVADAEAEAEAMERACRIAQLHDFIVGLPRRLRHRRRRGRSAALGR